MAYLTGQRNVIYLPVEVSIAVFRLLAPRPQCVLEKEIERVGERMGRLSG